MNFSCNINGYVTVNKLPTLPGNPGRMAKNRQHFPDFEESWNVSVGISDNNKTLLNTWNYCVDKEFDPCVSPLCITPVYALVPLLYIEHLGA